jgi:hypothetical protein
MTEPVCLVRDAPPDMRCAHGKLVSARCAACTREFKRLERLRIRPVAEGSR